ncbi:MAG: OBAP family protein, partial [Microcoleus sp. SIO2G3]|nr:OBAP family protein [Microcoleus sp. SIO2G3]
MRLSRIPSIILLLVIILLVNLLAAFGGGNTAAAASATPPGEEKSVKTKMLETGAAVLQNKTPLDAINVYVDAFHFHNGNLDRQLEAHHYCSVVNEDFIQCTLYDSNGKNARLMGIEYIVSEKSFQTLPQDEKKLWHSHVYEVKSG